MTRPAKPALTKDKVHCGKTSTSQLFLIGYLLLPCNSKDWKKASVVEKYYFFSCTVHVLLPIAEYCVHMNNKG